MHGQGGPKLRLKRRDWRQNARNCGDSSTAARAPPRSVSSPGSSPHRIAPGRHPDMPAECDAQRAGRAVADAVRDLRRGQLALPQQAPGDLHAPAQQVFHRRDADGAGEALEERRTRQRGGLRSCGTVQGRSIARASAAAPLRALVAQAFRRPGRIAGAGRAHGFDQQQLGQPRQHGRAAGAGRDVSAATISTSRDSRGEPRTCTSAGSSDTSRVGRPRRTRRHRPASACRVRRRLRRSAPRCRRWEVAGSSSTGRTASPLDSVNAGVSAAG